MEPHVKKALIATFIARTAINGALRIVYPFLPAIARGLDTTPTAVSGVIALRNLGGFVSPLVARRAERTGRRILMVIAMAVATVGCVLSAGANGLLIAGAGIVLVGLAKPAFDISMQAWFGDRVPYSERGRVFGITEYTWAMALVVTVPLSGYLIEATSWRAPFILVTVLCAVGTWIVGRGIASDRPHEHVVRPLRLTRTRVMALACVLLSIVAGEIPFIVYGQWLENDFGFSVAGIGAFTMVIVVAELIGQTSVVWLGDRLGLRAMVLVSMLVSAVAYFGLGFAGGPVVAAGVVVVWISSFEITIVAAIPFVSEMAVESRDRMLSAFAFMVAAGRAIGALIAQPLYGSGGIGLAGGVSAVCVLAAVLFLLAVPDHD
jgi:predicted MFS family arabinose efflux permease